MTSIYKNKRVLVTGGTGMVGVQLVKLLQGEGARVRVASLDTASPFGKEGRDIEFDYGNLMDWAFCQRVTKGMDYVFHLAGIKGSVGVGATKAASFLVPHLLMNTLVMEAARQEGIERYLYTSSIAVYHPTELFKEDEAWDGPPHPTDRFAAWAKRMGELQAEAYQIEHGWGQIAIVRPANVYGPHDNFNPETAMVVPALIARAASGEDPLVVWGDGTAVRDFVFSRDVARGMLLALEKSANCIPVNLGSGRGVSISQLVDAVLGCFPNPPQVSWDTSKPAGQPVRLMDTSRASELLGFRAQTSIQEGVRETIEWYLPNADNQSSRYNVFAKPNYL